MISRLSERSPQFLDSAVAAPSSTVAQSMLKLSRERIRVPLRLLVRQRFPTHCGGASWFYHCRFTYYSGFMVVVVLLLLVIGRAE